MTFASTDLSCARRAALFVAFCGLVLVPHLFSSKHTDAPLHLGAPRIFTGDEPHYILMLNSLLTDGDLDLADDYHELHRRGCPVLRSGLFPIDHHTTWYLADGQQVYWYEQWNAAKEVHERPRLWNANRFLPDPPEKEYSVHPPGHVLLVAPFVFPFRDSALLQSAAVVCSGIATILAMVALAALLRCFTDDTRLVYLVTALTAFGTPVWHYGRTFYAEPYLMALMLGAMALHLRKDAIVLPAILLSFGMLMKQPFVLAGVPIGVMLLWRRRWTDAVLYAAPFVVVAVLMLLMNQHMFGHPLRFAQKPSSFGFTPEGLIGILFNPRVGIVSLSPLALAAFAGWPGLFRKNAQAAQLILWSALPYCLLLSIFWPTWHGGAVYGPRYMMPMLPLLYLGLAIVPSGRVARRVWWVAIVVLGALSVLINALGAIPYWRFVGRHPLLWNR